MRLRQPESLSFSLEQGQSVCENYAEPPRGSLGLLFQVSLSCTSSLQAYVSINTRFYV